MKRTIKSVTADDPTAGIKAKTVVRAARHRKTRAVDKAPTSPRRMLSQTPEQREEIRQVARGLSNHMLFIAAACGPLNYDWIKTVILEVGEKLVSKLGGDEPADIIPFLLYLKMPVAAFASPGVLKAAVESKLNAIYETDPDTLESIMQGGMMLSSFMPDPIEEFFDYASSVHSDFADPENLASHLM